MNSETSSRTYTGWQLEKTTLVFGLSGQRCCILGLAMLCALWPLASSRISLAVTAWPLAAATAALAYMRIKGRTADEWIVSAVSYQLLRMRSQTRFASGAFAPAPKLAPEAAPAMDLPGILAPIEILEADAGGGHAVAIAHHRRDRTYTAVARIRYPGIGLVDSTRRDQRVAGWGRLMSSLCTEGNPIIRIQTLHRLVPESGAVLQRWHEDHLAATAPPISRQVTAELLSTATATARREAYLAFTMDERRAAAQIKEAGGGAVGAAAVLLRDLRALTGTIGAADLQVEGWLSPRDLAEVLRVAFDPDSRGVLDEARASAHAAYAAGIQTPARPGVAPQLAGPAAAEAMPGHYVHDGAVSATYWIHSWPDKEVYSTVLAPLLGDSDHRRSFSLHIEPLAPTAARSAVMHDRTKREVAMQIRRRTGKIIPRDEQVAAARAAAQDQERATGHGLVKFSGYCTVTETDPDKLANACAQLEKDAANAEINIRRMWLAQDYGFALAALPLGMGLPRRRWKTT